MSEREQLLFTISFQKAVSNIQSRAERFPDDPVTLRQMFVDAGLLDQLTNNRNQIVVGRRGTGKSHLLRALEANVIREQGLYLYLDCRQLGSGPLSGVPEKYSTVGSKWFASIIRRLSEFAFSEVFRRDSLDDRGRDLATDPLNPIATHLQHDRYAEIGACFESYLERIHVKYLTIVLDEWVQIPKDAQPYTSEQLKRTFIASRQINIKIAAIPLHSMFLLRQPSERIGLEVGADIFIDLDLDRFLIYDKDKEAVARFYADMLYRHLSLDLTIDSKDPLEWTIHTFFTQRDAFQELVRAAEGIPRDFLHIFIHAYRDAFRNRSTGQKISLPVVRRAAEKWYQDDKMETVRQTTQLSVTLQAIIDEVIGSKHVRMFIIEQDLSSHPLIMSLVDARLLHLVRRGWAHKENPGIRYDVMSIDFGAYANRINTVGQPELELFATNETTKDIVVPFDDMRAIRRVELKRDFLERFTKSTL